MKRLWKELFGFWSMAPSSGPTTAGLTAYKENKKHNLVSVIAFYKSKKINGRFRW